MGVARRSALLALTTTLIVVLTTSALHAADDPTTDQEHLNAEVTRILGQDDVIDIALKKSGVTIPDLSHVNQDLANPLVKETLVAVLEKELRSHPELTLEQLKAKAGVQSLSFLQFITKKKDMTLGQDDQVFANYLASKVFVTYHLARTNRSSVADNTVASAGLRRGRRSGSSVLRVAGNTTTPETGDSQEGGAKDQPSQLSADMSPSENAGKPSTQTPGADTGSSTNTVLPNLIDDENRDQVLIFLKKAKDRIVRTMQNNVDTPDPKILQARLVRFVQKPPDPGTFLEFLGTLTQKEITSYDSLSEADRAEILKMIDQVIASPTSTTPQPSAATPPSEPLAGALEGAANLAGEMFIPGFSRFEPLVDQIIEGGVPVIERWRPFQRCFGRDGAGTGRGIFGTRSARGVYYMEP